MEKSSWICLVIATALSLAFVTGCNGKSEVTIPIRYERPAEVEIPTSIQKLAVAEFEGAGNHGRMAGAMAADTISSLFDEYNRKYHRYKVYDRAHVRKVLEEKQLQMAFSDPGSVVKAGKFAGVDAMIVGRVTASGQDSQVSESYFDIISQSMRQRMVTIRQVSVNVSMKLISVKSGREFVTRAAFREYDSSDKKKGGGSGGLAFIGIGGSKLKGVQATVEELLRQCMRELHGVISPHDVAVQVSLQRGRSKDVKTGNVFADEGNYKEALTYYLRAIQAMPDDHGAMFNAGAMYEAMGDLPNAQKMYGRAMSVNADRKYIVARNRVKTAP